MWGEKISHGLLLDIQFVVIISFQDFLFENPLG